MSTALPKIFKQKPQLVAGAISAATISKINKKNVEMQANNTDRNRGEQDNQIYRKNKLNNLLINMREPKEFFEILGI